MGFSWSQNIDIIFKRLKFHNMILYNEKKKNHHPRSLSYVKHKIVRVEGGGEMFRYKHLEKNSILTDTPFSSLLFEDLGRKGRE